MRIQRKLKDLQNILPWIVKIECLKKTKQSILSKEKNSLERIKQIELSAIQTIKNQASNELNLLISNYLKNLSELDKSAILSKSISEFKSLN